MLRKIDYNLKNGIEKSLTSELSLEQSYQFYITYAHWSCQKSAEQSSWVLHQMAAKALMYLFTYLEQKKKAENNSDS